MIALLIFSQISLGFIHQDVSPEPSAVSLKTLLNEMGDCGFLTSYPNPSYHLFQTSSWDREELKGKDSKGWFANKDYDNYIRKETNGKRTEYVIMDARGPGAITRWWFPQIELLG